VRIFLGINASDAEIKDKYINERKLVKEVALSLFYGADSERIRETAMKYGFIWSKQQCRDIHRRFKETYETVFKYKLQLDRALESGASMQNVMGRVLRIPNKADVYMQGFNTLCQSSASDMLLDASRRASDALAGRAHPLLFVHDEMIFETKEEDSAYADGVVKGSMESFKLPTVFGNIPVVAEGGISDFWSKG
jgi:DNA polymerase I-like protein with 3'-5' exonuclease and polymerase domains